MTLGDLISNYRQRNKVSMDEFAKMAGLSKPYISMLEKNKNSRSGKPIIPSVTTIKKVAKVLNITFEDVMKALDKNQEISLDDGPSEVPGDDSPHLFPCTPEEEKMIKKFRRLSPTGKQSVLAILDIQYEAVAPRAKNGEVI